MTHIKKFFLTVSIIVMSLLLFTFLVFAKGPIRSVEGIVKHVNDGDTLKVETTEGTKLKVRLYGIDAPETEKIKHKSGMISKPGQPYGEESYRALKSKVLGKNVKVEIIDIDRYKRMVGIVYMDGININLEMVKEGWDGLTKNI